MTETIVSLILAATACAALRKHQDVYSLLVEGAGEGLRLRFPLYRPW